MSRPVQRQRPCWATIMSRGSAVRALASAMLLILPAMLAGSVAGPAYAAPGDPGDVPAAAMETTMVERVTVYAPADTGAAEQQSVLTLVSTLPGSINLSRWPSPWSPNRGVRHRRRPRSSNARLSSRRAPWASPWRTQATRVRTFGSPAAVTNSPPRYRFWSTICRRWRRPRHSALIKRGRTSAWPATR
jgi:hypothetical protein